MKWGCAALIYQAAQVPGFATGCRIRICRLSSQTYHLSTERSFLMSVAKVLEITSSSKKSFDDAVALGIKRASETIADIQGAWVQDQKVVVNKGKITKYRVSLNITFVLAGKKK